MERRELFYSGHVQGVGFRYRTQSLAARFAVFGFVCNLPDGRVQLVVEGESRELEAFLRSIREDLADHIRECREDCRPGTGEFTRFEIRH